MKAHRHYTQQDYELQPINHNVLLERIMKVISVIGLTSLLFTVFSCSKMSPNESSAELSSSDPKLVLSDQLIDHGKPIIITFDNGNNNACGIAEIQVSKDHGVNWETICKDQPTEGITNCVFTAEEPGYYFFRASWQDLGEHKCDKTFRQISYTETQMKNPLVVQTKN